MPVIVFYLVIPEWVATVLNVYGQTIDNVRFHQTDEDKVIVTYDISGGEGRTFEVTLTLSDDGGSNFLIVPRSVSGDVGPNVKGGRGKQIVWDVLADIRRLEGTNYVFKVSAKSQGGATISGIEYVLIRGGTFEMGDAFGDGEADERPLHSVTLSDYYLGKTEVTVAQYRAFCSSTGRSMPDAPSWGWQDSHPVVNVSWNDAVAFCSYARCRLPTEAEWEFAAREGGQRIKWSGTSDENRLAEYAWWSSNSDGHSQPVASKRSNALGLYDMSGNVWEWCSDWYGNDYYRSGPAVNPQGPSSGRTHVLRGGSWGDNVTRYLRCSSRVNVDPEVRVNYVGFRVCRSAGQRSVFCFSVFCFSVFCYSLHYQAHFAFQRIWMTIRNE